MPTYTFKCPSGHRFEQMRPIKHRDGIATCPECRVLAFRVPDAPAFALRGAGFHANDYAKPRATARETD
jgi:putative FmdB family regulatory protein